MERVKANDGWRTSDVRYDAREPGSAGSLTAELREVIAEKCPP